ncbi:MAG: O-antigen ligase family protein [bacterium]
MQAASDALRHYSHRKIVAISLASALVGSVLVTRPVESVVVPAVLLFFLLFLKDIRLIVPIAIFLCPLGPKFEMTFGNLYAMTTVLGLAYLAWIYQMIIGKQELRFHLERPVVALLVFVGSLLLAFLWAPEAVIHNRVELLRFVQLLMYLFLFFMVMQMRFSLKQIRRLLIFVLCAGIIEIFIGLYQWLTRPGFYIVGTFDREHTLYAVYIMLISTMLLALILEEKSFKRLALWCILLGLAIFTIIFSFCRTAYVAFPVGMLVLLVTPFNRKRRIVLFFFLLALPAIVWGAVGPEVRVRAMTIVNNLTGQAIDISFGSRMRHWTRVTSNLPQHIVFGKGIATSLISDNAYVKIVTEAGLLGLGTFLWLLFELLRIQWRIAVKSGVGTFMSAVAKSLPAATVACIVVPNLAMDTIWTHRFMGVYWIVTALLKKWSDQSAKTSI